MLQRRLLSARGGSLLLVGLVMAAAAAWQWRDQLPVLLELLLESVHAFGPWASALLTLAYIPACLCLVPTSIITPGVGFALGAVQGSVVALLGVVLGAAANYGVARWLGRAWFDQHVERSHRFRAVEIACRTRGFQMVMLTRLTPVFPSNFMSYFFGVTSVHFPQYMVATTVGMLPRTLVAVTVGATAKSLAESVHSPLHERQWMLYSAAVVTLAVFVLLGRIANAALQQALADVDASPQQATPAAAVAEPPVSAANWRLDAEPAHTPAPSSATIRGKVEAG